MANLPMSAKMPLEYPLLFKKLDAEGRGFLRYVDLRDFMRKLVPGISTIGVRSVWEEMTATKVPGELMRHTGKKGWGKDEVGAA